MTDLLDLNEYSPSKIRTDSISLNSIKSKLELLITQSTIFDDEQGSLYKRLMHSKVEGQVSIKWLHANNLTVAFGDLLQDEKKDLQKKIFNFVKTNKSIPIFSLIPFQNEPAANDSDWKDWTKKQNIIPQILLSQDEKDHKKYNLIELSIPMDSQRPLIFSSATKYNFNDFFSLKDTDTEKQQKQQWNQNLKTLLESLENPDQDLSKVVMARPKRLTPKQDFDPISLFYELSQTHEKKKLTHFCIEKDNLCFMGFSPENLLLKDSEAIKIDAVAGTRPRSNDETLDRELENELLNSNKDQREHQEVIDSIRKSTEKIGTLTIGEQYVLKLSGVQHLKTPLSIKEHKESSETAFKLVSVLHPTPAVGGTPTVKALNTIKELESFERGLYSGTIGFSFKEKSQFIVAIRSLLIKPNTEVILYAGAGIVSGSVAEDEWIELENKFDSFFPVNFLYNEETSQTLVNTQDPS